MDYSSDDEPTFTSNKAAKQPAKGPREQSTAKTTAKKRNIGKAKERSKQNKKIRRYLRREAQRLDDLRKQLTDEEMIKQDGEDHLAQMNPDVLRMLPGGDTYRGNFINMRWMGMEARVGVTDDGSGRSCYSKINRVDFVLPRPAVLRDGADVELESRLVGTLTGKVICSNNSTNTEYTVEYLHDSPWFSQSRVEPASEPQ